QKQQEEHYTSLAIDPAHVMSSRDSERLGVAESEASTAGLMRESRDSRRLSSSSSSGRRWKTVPVTVVLPDCSAFFMELREDCKGFDCLAKMCEVLGIVEVDYFGLKYADRLAGCEAWVNTRLNLRRQLKRTNQPYRLAFRVKFFTDSILCSNPPPRTSKHVAVDKYLEKVGDLECGINSYRGYYEDKHVSINVGSRHIHIIDSNNATINK
ncbi:E3 ubiquitin-protein ligase MYLIP, partial [Geodia barretti]